jgi:1-acyl-sn-glycerol-3-phosphate acyltransferase
MHPPAHPPAGEAALRAETRVAPDFGGHPALPRAGWSWPRVLNWHLARVLTFLLDRLMLRMEVRGVDTVPRDGPFLLLPNHTTFLDPFVVTAPLGRPCTYMASVALLRVPLLGWWLAKLGAFPKIKYVKDRDAMATMQRLWDEGNVVTIFPEGRRCWDGETLPLQPGMGRLIKRLDAKVVYARLHNAYLFQPRWAKYPRYVPLEIDYDGPHHYGPEWTDEALDAEVQGRIRAHQRLRPGMKVFGWRMAHGLPALLWSCPACRALEALEVDARDGDKVRCRACRAGWRVDAESLLHPDAGGPVESVGAHYRAQLRHFGAPPTPDPALLAREGVVLRGAQGAIRRVQKKGRPALVAAGEVTLTPQALELRGPDGQPTWARPLSALETISIEVGNRVQLRVDGELHELDVGGRSLLLWGHFLLAWKRPGEEVLVG